VPVAWQCRPPLRPSSRLAVGLTGRSYVWCEVCQQFVRQGHVPSCRSETVATQGCVLYRPRYFEGRLAITIMVCCLLRYCDGLLTTPVSAKLSVQVKGRWSV